MYLDPDNLRDTGSPKMQVRYLGERMRQLVRHLTKHKHDRSARFGLIQCMYKYVTMKKLEGEEYASSYWEA